MLQGLSVPATDGALVCRKFLANLLPCIVVKVPILQDHSFIRVWNGFDDFPDLFLKLREKLKLVRRFLLQIPEPLKRPHERRIHIPCGLDAFSVVTNG